MSIPENGIVNIIKVMPDIPLPYKEKLDGSECLKENEVSYRGI
jgi:hypothetical protein